MHLIPLTSILSLKRKRAGVRGKQLALTVASPDVTMKL
jgi:hypothetical protein